MQETSTGIRIGVTLMIISTVFIIMLSMYAILNEYNADYYEEQARILTDIDAEMQSLMDTRIPMIQLCDQLMNSVYGRNLHQLIVEEPVRNNGVLASTPSKRTYSVGVDDYITVVTRCKEEMRGKVGTLTEIKEASGTYTITVKVGG